MHNLLLISPIDGRYHQKTEQLNSYFSEYALIKYRVFVELKWLIFLSEKKILNFEISNTVKDKLNSIYDNFELKDAERVKEIESTTNHDVKAVEYFLREKFEQLGIIGLNPFIHIFLTSEDVNNTSYNLMLKNCLRDIYYPELSALENKLKAHALTYSDVSMLSHTHGQIATPTTVGKEFKVFEYRLKKVQKYLENVEFSSKFSGTVGNFNCHMVIRPDLDWQNIAREFVESLGLDYNPVTTQIESHDMLCLLLSHIKIINNIVKDLGSDLWLYISMGYFHEKLKQGEVGSSVMPHKVNPINAENAMANVEISNSLIDGLVNNLSISRMQRDLSDSSKMRNIGVILAHSLISLKEIQKTLGKIEVNYEFLDSELENNYTVLSEAVQTMLRSRGVENAYELLKGISRGKVLTAEQLHEFIGTLPLDESDKNSLISLTPKNYTGLASKIAKED